MNQGLTVVLETEAERRIVERASTSGMSEADFLRRLIEYSVAYFQMAVERLEAPLTSSEARERLGLGE